MLAEGLVALLLSDTGVVGINGTPAARQAQDPQGRLNPGVFAVQMPEGIKLPAIVYLVISDEDLMTLDGPNAFTSARVQFSCYGTQYADSQRLCRAVRLALENFQGILVDGTEIDSIHRVSELDAFEDAPFGYATHVDFEVSYRDIGT